LTAVILSKFLIAAAVIELELDGSVDAVEVIRSSMLVASDV
jgi:hypothetical protein